VVCGATDGAASPVVEACERPVAFDIDAAISVILIYAYCGSAVAGGPGAIDPPEATVPPLASMS